MKEIYAAMQEALGVNIKVMAEEFAKRRYIPIFGKIDDDLASDVGKTLISMDLKGTSPITLLIDSSGGDITAAENIGDIIDSLQSPVDGLVMRDAKSAAVAILFRCRARLALPNSNIFIHSGHCGASVELSSDLSEKDVATIIRKIGDTRKRKLALYMRRLKMSAEQVQELISRGDRLDIEYPAKQALELNMVDDIVTDFKFWSVPKTP